MLKHILKLVWNRKRMNVLLIMEIFISFLVLCAVAVAAVHLVSIYKLPSGFSYSNVSHVHLEVNMTTGDVWTPAEVETTRQLYQTLEAHPNIEYVAATNAVPYMLGNSSGTLYYEGRSFESEFGEATDKLADVLDLNVVRGRWFDARDVGMNEVPVVLNKELSDRMFGDEDPIGRELTDRREGGRRLNIVGVVEAYRLNGEFYHVPAFCFSRADLTNSERRPPRELLLKLRQPTTVDFEEELVRSLQAVAPERSFKVESMDAMRSFYNRIVLVPLLVFGLVSGFLLLMVGLGLAGVLWQNVTSRIGEFGVRRAVGGSITDIQKQVLGEMLMLTTFSVILGLVVVIQFPLFGVLGLGGLTYGLGILVALLVLYLSILLCGWYPSRLATHVHPAQALHYE
jgi:putative ABC transport system permease protein